ncbi:MAG: PSD1 and planctomycete cytochrome C domain-containing protein [Planctomycetaceae bacterium]
MPLYRYSALLHVAFRSFACFLVTLVPASGNAEAQEPTPVFETEVRPILKEHCWHCHGEEAELKGSLDTRLVRLMMSGGDSGPAIVAGDHASSLLYDRIASGDMPPSKAKVSPEELAVIVRWIDAGAKTSRSEPEQISPGALLLEEERNHWSFQPIAQPNVPDVTGSHLVRNPIDAFLLAKLESHGLSFSEPADKATLIRRAYFDLIGLPPSPQVVAQFVNSESPDAWAEVVDRLLASEHYGERWGRHWLDVAGYADSDGYTEKDPERKWAFKYRDYVIQSLNADKPWDQFIVEQLAGDELLTPPYKDLAPDQAACLTATGFLRMIPDGTADGSVDQNVARNDVMAETIKVVSTSLLGLSVGCAQCHEHRYDPITQADYYRLRAIFEPAYDWKNWRSPNARLVSMWSAETRAAADEVDKELKDVAAKRTEELDQIVADTFERELQKVPAELQSVAREARETAADKRTDQHKNLIKQYPFLNVNRGTVYLYLKDRLNGHKKKWDDLTAEVQKKRPAEDLVMCLTEVAGKVPVTTIFSRGDHQQPREEVVPAELTILCSGETQIPVNDESLETTGRRLAYARHLTSGQHPLVARVLVNRFWLHHFGRGIVGTPSDFGIKGEPPSHAELLDWLAADFMTQGWSLKHFHRLVLNSAAWQQSSVHRPELDAVDPENRLIGRMSVRRLESEIVRDALLSVSGLRSDKMYGPPIPVSPDEIGQIVLMNDNRDSAGRPSGKKSSLGEDEFRRSIYVQQRRSMPLGVLEPFDLPIVTPNCELRPSSTGPSQALMMMNNPFVVQSSQAMAERLITETPADLRAQVVLAWQLLFSHAPSDQEVDDAVAFVQSFQSPEDANLVTGDGSVVAPVDAGSQDTNRLALAYLCHSLMSSNGFLYVD